MTTLLFVCLLFYLVVLWFGVINSNEGTNPIALLIISTIVFGVMIIITTFLIIQFCYGYWILLDDSIIYKKLFSKKRKINLQLKTYLTIFTFFYSQMEIIIKTNTSLFHFSSPLFLVVRPADSLRVLLFLFFIRDVIARPLGRGDLPVQCGNSVDSTKRLPRRPFGAPRNDML